MEQSTELVIFRQKVYSLKAHTRNESRWSEFETGKNPQLCVHCSLEFPPCNVAHEQWNVHWWLFQINDMMKWHTEGQHNVRNYDMKKQACFSGEKKKELQLWWSPFIPGVHKLWIATQLTGSIKSEWSTVLCVWGVVAHLLGNYMSATAMQKPTAAPAMF